MIHGSELVLRKPTVVGSIRVEMVSVGGGMTWVWPGSDAVPLHEIGRELREAEFQRLKTYLQKSLRRHQ